MAIVNSWSLIAFAREKGKMQVGSFVNKESGELFTSCIFTHPTSGVRVFVGFSPNLGVLTPKEIAASKEGLQVVQLDTGSYRLCKAGESQWEDVDLGI